MTVLPDALVEHNAIIRERARSVRNGVLWSVVQSQALFWSLVLGWSLGPSRLGGGDLIAGATFTLALGVTMSWPFSRRRLEHGRQGVILVGEGGRRRRLAFFDEYFTIDKEIVLRSSVMSASFEESALWVTYAEPTEGAPVVRTFEGPREKLARVHAELSGESA